MNKTEHISQTCKVNKKGLEMYVSDKYLETCHNFKKIRKL